MDESFFNALRIVAVMIGIDLDSRKEERDWFMTLLKKYGIPNEQISILNSDLRGESSVEEIHRGITNASDRERLMTWARFAANIDGVVHPREKKLLEQIDQLNRDAGGITETDAIEYLKAVKDTQKDMDMWSDLNDVGSYYIPLTPGAYIPPRPEPERRPPGFGRHYRKFTPREIIFILLIILACVAVSYFFPGRFFRRGLL